MPFLYLLLSAQQYDCYEGGTYCKYSKCENFSSLHDIRDELDSIIDENNKLRIRLIDGDIDVFNGSMFRSINKLESLSIFGCKIGSIPNNAFKGMNSLKRLNIVGNEIEIVESWIRKSGEVIN